MKLFILFVFAIFASSQICDKYEFWNEQMCVQCATNCTCQEALGCEQLHCDQGFAINGKCEPLPEGCLEADLDQIIICTKCSSDYSLYDGMCLHQNPTDTLSRQDFTLNSFNLNSNYDKLGSSLLACKRRNSDTLTCEQCPLGYFMNANKYCQECGINNCKECLTPSKCLTCQDGYYQKQNGNNIVCDDCKTLKTYNEAVLTCNMYRHLTCQPGYYVTKDECTSCQINNCNECEHSQKCTVCADGYYLRRYQCVPCDSRGYCKKCKTKSTCEECIDAISSSLAIDDNGLCQICSLGCAECSYKDGVQECSKCKSNYYEDNGTCQPCFVVDDTWLFCNSATELLQCKRGYNLVDGKCIENLGNCLTMKSDGKCDTCYPGNDVVEGTCISCSQKFENCHQCNDDHSACIGCQNTFTLVEGVCTPCEATDCRLCPSQICTDCNKGYYFSTFFGEKQCYKCPKGCSECVGLKTDSSYGLEIGVECTACEKNFFLEEKGCKEIMKLCYQANEDGTKCLQCVQGARVYKGRCIPKMDILAGYQFGVNVGFNDEQLQCLMDKAGIQIKDKSEEISEEQEEA